MNSTYKCPNNCEDPWFYQFAKQELLVKIGLDADGDECEQMDEEIQQTNNFGYVYCDHCDTKAVEVKDGIEYQQVYAV